MPGELAAHVVRSPHAHARVRAVQTARAAAAPGVVAVLTGSDMASDRVGPMRYLWPIRSSDGRPLAEPPRFALAHGVVRHVGEAVALVVAQSAAHAADAAELVEVEYDVLPAVVSSEDAVREGARQLHVEAPGNLAFRFTRGDEAAVRDGFARAAHVTRIDLVNNRLTGAAIEPRAVIAVPDGPERHVEPRGEDLRVRPGVALPRADHFPEIVSEFDQSQPCTHNPIGAKGCGESGAIGAPAATVSAVLDALAPLGVTDLEMR